MTSYADPATFATFGLPSTATVGMTNASLQAHLDAASNRFDEAADARGALPIVGALGPPNTYPPRLQQLVCEIASFTMLRVRGFNPESPNDVAVLDAHDRAIADLERIKGHDAIPWLGTAAPTAVQSDSPRGYFPSDTDTNRDDGTGAIGP